MAEVSALFMEYHHVGLRFGKNLLNRNIHQYAENGGL